AVGSATAWTPRQDNTGTMTESAARPKPGRSWMANTVLGALDIGQNSFFCRLLTVFATILAQSGPQKKAYRGETKLFGGVFPHKTRRGGQVNGVPGAARLPPSKGGTCYE